MKEGENMEENKQLEAMARKLKNERSKAWARKNKDKIKEINKRYWLKKAKEKLAEEKAEKKAAKEAKHDNYSANSSQSIKTEHHHNSGAPAGNHGDMNTTDSGKIVGNRNSKIYHVPGQAGYRMNSANAVYFDSEAEAKAAGYRKALR